MTRKNVFAIAVLCLAVLLAVGSRAAIAAPETAPTTRPTTEPATTMPAVAAPQPPASPAAHAPPADPQKGNHFEVGDNLIGLSPAWQAAFIVGATLISEDLTCIAVGSLIGKRKVNWLVAGGACFLGIYIGDLLFFLIGRGLGNRVLRMRVFARSLGEERLRKFGAFFDRRPWAAIAACRILPGLRVPLYVTVGALTTRTRAFFWWTCLFAFVWTPALIALVAVLGEAFTSPFERVMGQGWLSIVVEIAVIYLAIRLVILMSTRAGRRTLWSRLTWPVRLLTGRRGEPAEDIAAGEVDELLEVAEKIETRVHSHERT